MDQLPRGLTLERYVCSEWHISCASSRNASKNRKELQIITKCGCIVIRIKWLGNLAAFFVLCFCALFPFFYMTLILHRLQKSFRYE